MARQAGCSRRRREPAAGPGPLQLPFLRRRADPQGRGTWQGDIALSGLVHSVRAVQLKEQVQSLAGIVMGGHP